jgi:hypothetical protein
MRSLNMGKVRPQRKPCAANRFANRHGNQKPLPRQMIDVHPRKRLRSAGRIVWGHDPNIRSIFRLHGHLAGLRRCVVEATPLFRHG